MIAVILVIVAVLSLPDATFATDTLCSFGVFVDSPTPLMTTAGTSLRRWKRSSDAEDLGLGRRHAPAILALAAGLGADRGPGRLQGLAEASRQLLSDADPWAAVPHPLVR